MFLRLYIFKITETVQVIEYSRVSLQRGPLWLWLGHGDVAVLLPGFAIGAKPVTRQSHLQGLTHMALPAAL